MLNIFFFILFLILIFSKSRPLFIYLIAIQIVSFIGMKIINLDDTENSVSATINGVFTILILGLIIFPWRSYGSIKSFEPIDEVKLKKFTRFLLIISIVPFIVFSVISIISFLTITDINEFKYTDGLQERFFATLPFSPILILLASYLCGFSYFLIPLHFYYLLKKEYRLSNWCLVFSLNIILVGFAFFSRAVFAHYGLIYAGFLILFYNSLAKRVKKYIVITLFLTLGGIIFYFSFVTNNRFKDADLYSETVSNKSLIKDTVSYSYFDYLSQWYQNNMNLLEAYNYKTFNGQISFQPIIQLLRQIGFFSDSERDYMALRQELWPNHWYAFNGFVAYSLYDYGYILTIFFSLLYYYIVVRLKPKNSQISLLNLFLTVLLIQLPLLAIFYSAVGGIMISLLLLIPISMYLKFPKVIKRI